MTVEASGKKWARDDANEQFQCVCRRVYERALPLVPGSSRPAAGPAGRKGEAMNPEIRMSAHEQRRRDRAHPSRVRRMCLSCFAALPPDEPSAPRIWCLSPYLGSRPVADAIWTKRKEMLT